MNNRILCNIPLDCPVTDICSEILTMTKESNALIDTLYATGIIDDQLNNSLGNLSYKLAQFSSDAINTESMIQYFIQKIITKLHDYRSFYTRMGGKEPSVIYESGQPITMTVTNKAIFYVEGSYDNGHGGPSLQQQQELIAISTLDTTKKKVTTSANNSGSNTGNQRKKPKYVALATDDNEDISSQVIMKSLQQKQQQQQQTPPTKPTPNHIEFMRQLEREKTIFIEIMGEYYRIIGGVDFNIFLQDILEFRDQELFGAYEILEPYLDKISIYKPDDILRKIVDTIDTERKNLLDYNMNIIHRWTQCTEYYNRHYRKIADHIDDKNEDMVDDDEENEIRPVTSMYFVF